MQALRAPAVLHTSMAVHAPAEGYPRAWRVSVQEDMNTVGPDCFTAEMISFNAPVPIVTSSARRKMTRVVTTPGWMTARKMRSRSHVAS